MFRKWSYFFIKNWRGNKMKIIIEVENDIELVNIEIENLKAFVRRLGFKVISIKNSELKKDVIFT